MGGSTFDFIGGAFAIAGAFLTAGIPFVGAQLSAALFAYGTGLIVRGYSRATAQERVRGIKSNVVDTQGNLPVIYGKMRVGMRMADVRVVNSDTIPGADPTAIFAGADNNDVLVKVGAFCLGSEDGSGIADINQIEFNAERAPWAVFNPPVSWEDDPVGGIDVGARYDNYLKYQLRPGSDAQLTSSELQTHLGWDAAAAGRGICYGSFWMLYNEDVYTSGIPSITAEITGNRVFDPRSDTWAWSDNPALCILDYLTSKRYGAGYIYIERDGGGTANESMIDEQSFIDAANYCDQLVATTSGNEKRFTFNGAIDTGRNVAANLQSMLTSCRGSLVWQDGKIRLVIRQSQSPVAFELTQDNIVGQWEWIKRGSTIPNHIEATYLVENVGDYNMDSVVWPLIGDHTLLVEDNNIDVRQEIDLPFTLGQPRALRIAMVMLREQRRDVVVSVTAHPEALQLQVGDVVQVTHDTPGWNQKEFYVLGMSLLKDGNVRVHLHEYDSSDYVLSSFDPRPDDPDTDLPDPFFVPPPTALTITADGTTAKVTQDGIVQPRIFASWTAPVDYPFVNHYEVRFRNVNDNVWVRANDADPADEQIYIFPVESGADYDIEVVAVSTVGSKSAVLSGSVTVNTVPSQPSLSGDVTFTGNVNFVNADLTVNPSPGTQPLKLLGLTAANVLYEIPPPPADSTSYYLTFNSAAAWGWTSTVGGVSNLTDLDDVTITAPAGREFLIYTGSIWENADIVPEDLGGGAPLAVGDVLQVSSIGPTVATWQALALTSADISDFNTAVDARLDTNQSISGAWTFTNSVTLTNAAINVSASPGTTRLNLVGLDASNNPWKIPEPVGTGQFYLGYNSAGTYSWGQPTFGATSLDELSDVTITAVASRDLLIYTGSVFENTNLVPEDLGGGTPAVNQVLQITSIGPAVAQWQTLTTGDISNFTSQVNSLIDSRLDTTQTITGAWTFTNSLTLTNAEINVSASPGATALNLIGLDASLNPWKIPEPTGTGNKYLVYNSAGTYSWGTVPTGATSLDELSDVSITAVAGRDLLIYTGTQWENTTLQPGDLAASGPTAVDQVLQVTSTGPYTASWVTVETMIESLPSGTTINWGNVDSLNIGGQILFTDAATNWTLDARSTATMDFEWGANVVYRMDPTNDSFSWYMDTSEVMTLYGGSAGPSLRLQGNKPSILLRELDAPVGEKYTRIEQNATEFRVLALDDGGGTGDTLMIGFRSGTAWGTLGFYTNV